MRKRESILRLNDEKLLGEFMDWVRIYRNEGTLPEDDRAYFKEICAEIQKRKLLKFRDPYKWISES